MPTREPELYKDKIEVSLDGRQIFYLFFGGAVIVGLVFVVGVLVGRRVESRGHLDRAATQSASDPLAALDRLEKTDRLSFRSTLTGGEPTSDGEKVIGEIEARRAAARTDKPDRDKKDAPRTQAAVATPATRPLATPAAAIAVEAKPSAAERDAKAERADRSDRREARVEPGNRSDADRPKSDKPDGERKPKKQDDSSGEIRPDGKHADARTDRPVTRLDGEARNESRGEARNDAKGEARSESKGEARSEGRSESKGEARSEGRSESKGEARSEGRSESKGEGRNDAKGEGRSDAKSEGKSEPKGEGRSEGRSEVKAEPRVRFTLQLSSFQDKAEAEAFLSSIRSAGFQPYVTEAEVSGKGTFYRVRLGSYRSLDAANDAKAEYERSAKKTAQVMRL